MPSTQSSLSIDSTAKVNDVGLVNQQPPPALTMTIDRNGPEQHATRLRGGCCCVRHSSAVPIPNSYAFFSKSNSSAVAATVRSAVEEESTDVVCNEV